MTEELYFPPVGPDTNKEYKASNGVTYTWTQPYSAWMIGSSQQVNKDYVDSRDQLRLRLDGYNFMYGDLTIRETAEVGSTIGAQLKQSGVLSLGINKEINFLGDGGSINVSGTSFLGFSNNYINVDKTFRFNRNLKTFGRYEGSKEQVTLFDFASSSKVICSIALSKHSNSYFTIRKSGSDYALFRVRSDGQTQIRSYDTDKPFVVLPSNENFGDAAFYVDRQKGVFCSSDLNTRLKKSDNAATPVSERSVATKGYVDMKSPRPGFSVVATSEAEAEIGGFWRNGNNLYVRVS